MTVVLKMRLILFQCYFLINIRAKKSSKKSLGSLSFEYESQEYKKNEKCNSSFLSAVNDVAGNNPDAHHHMHHIQLRRTCRTFLSDTSITHNNDVYVQDNIRNFI